MLTLIDKAYQCLLPLSTIKNRTHSQTCLSMLTSIDKAYQCLPPLSTTKCLYTPATLLTNAYLH